MHVVTTRRRYKGKTYETHLLRRSVRDGAKVRKETLANLSHLPPAAIEAVRRALAGEALVAAGEGFEIARSLPHGHVAAVAAAAKTLGFPSLLGPPCAERDIAFALVVARVCRPASKLATTRWWVDTTLAVDLGVDEASTDDVYAAMDWLGDRQADIEASLARRHLEPGGMGLFDLTSAWVEGRCCPLAARGYSRDGKAGRDQIEYGLLTDPDGRPVAVEVFSGNTGDPTAFVSIVQTVTGRFGLDDLVLVGDRGMITQARITALRDSDTNLGWITALRAPAIAKLAADDGPLQLSLFDHTSLAEIAHPDYPGERLVACRNPALATERARKRNELLAATETELDKIAAAVTAGRLVDPAKIGQRVGRHANRYKMAKHYDFDISPGHFAYQRRADQITTEAALDGIYVLRTSIPATQLDAPGVVVAYKNLAHVEWDFRSIKTIDLDLRPIYHRLEDRVRAHVLICMLAAYVTWHLRRAWAPLCFTDENPPQRTDPVAPAQRSPHAHTKASQQTTTTGQPAHNLATLLHHLATLTRDTIVFSDSAITIDKLATPTPTQQHAYQLLNTPIPTTL